MTIAAVTDTPYAEARFDDERKAKTTSSTPTSSIQLMRGK